MNFKKLHLYLHNRYELIRFWVAIITAIVVLIALFNTIQDNRRVTQQRAAQIESIVRKLQEDNAKQTQLIACLLAIHGENVAISKEDAARCRAEAQTQVNEATPPTTMIIGPAPAQTSNAPATSTPMPPAPTPPDDPEPNLLERVVQNIGRTLDLQ